MEERQVCFVSDANTLIKQAADLEAIQKGFEDFKAGCVTPVKEFDQAFRKEMGFSPRAKG